MTEVKLSVFDVLADERGDEIAARREASVRADLRCRHLFGRFLAASQTPDEFEARLGLVEDSLVRTCADVADRHDGGDLEDLRREVVASLRGEYSPPRQVKEALRRPHLCPYHKDMVDVSLTSGDPAAGYTAVQNLAYTDKHCQGEGYEGGRCKFRPEMNTQTYWDERQQKLDERRERRQQEPEAPQEVIPAEESTEVLPAEGFEEELVEGNEPSLSDALEAAPSAVGMGAEDELAVAASLRKEAPGKEHMPGVGEKRNRQYEHIKKQCLEDGGSEERCKEMAARTVNKTRSEKGETKGSRTADENWLGAPRMTEDVGVDYGAASGATDGYRLYQELIAQGVPREEALRQATEQTSFEYESPEQTPRMEPPLARVRRAEALETVDVTKGGETPFPEMDESRWTPDNPGEPPESEGDGSPHPTRRQDIAETPQYEDGTWEDDGRHEQTDAVLEKQDAGKKNEVKPKTDHDFPGSRDLSAVGAVEDDNPLREYLDGGFLTPEQVEASITSYRAYDER